MGLLSDRQQQLIDWLRSLRSQRSITVAEVQEHFGVSSATAYRDIKALIQAGLALKTSEGFKIPPPPGRFRPEGQCFYCGGTINERTYFLIQLVDGNQRMACCSHCGLLALAGQPDVESALAVDFLYGRMVNIRQASFVVGSRVNLCCDPSVLCFTNPEDAGGFQQGFGGQVFSLEHAVVHLTSLMKLQAQPDAG
jgi:hypothetical protein